MLVSSSMPKDWSDSVALGYGERDSLQEELAKLTTDARKLELDMKKSIARLKEFAKQYPDRAEKYVIQPERVVEPWVESLFADLVSTEFDLGQLELKRSALRTATTFPSSTRLMPYPGNVIAFLETHADVEEGPGRTL